MAKDKRSKILKFKGDADMEEFAYEVSGGRKRRDDIDHEAMAAGYEAMGRINLEEARAAESVNLHNEGMQLINDLAANEGKK